MFLIKNKKRHVLLLLLLINLIAFKLQPVATKPEHKADKKLIQKSKKLSLSFLARNKIASILKENKTDININKLNHVSDTIYSQSLEYGYDPLFVLAIIKTESSFLNRAVSKKGARGLMQIIPATAKEIAKKKNMSWEGVKTLHTPWSNVRMGTYYFSELMKRFGDVEIALEAYNNGPTRISRMIRKGRKPSFKYAKKVLHNYQTLLDAYGSV